MGGHLAGWGLDRPAEHGGKNDGCWQTERVCVCVSGLIEGVWGGG